MPLNQLLWQVFWWLYVARPEFFHIPLRAIELTVKSGYSTSFFVVVATLGTRLYVHRKKIFVREFLRREWRDAMKWTQEGKDTVKAGTICIAVAFGYQLLVAAHEKPTYTASQILKFSYGCTVAIAQKYTSDPSAMTASGTGFWVDTHGHFVTYMAISPWTETALPIVGTLSIPDMRGKNPYEMSPFWAPGTRRLDYDTHTGLALLWTANNPLQRAEHPFISINGSEKDLEQFHLAHISTETPDVGDVLYVTGIESGSLTISQGQIQRIGLSESPGSSGERFFTSIPFKGTFLGAPVFDSSGQIVGVVGNSTSEVVVIPASELQKLVQKEGIS